MRSFSRSDLIEFISVNSANLHSMNLDQFRDWLTDRITETSSSPLFQQRCHVRDLKRTHRRRLRDRERRLEEAQRIYELTSSARKLEDLARETEHLRKAVEGLTLAVAEDRADPVKLDQFRKQLAVAEDQTAKLIALVPEKKRFDRATASLAALQDEIGLSDAEESLRIIATHQGNSSVRSGARFEEISSIATQKLIVPLVTSVGEKAFVLHGATLGCARGEFDQLVVVDSENSEFTELRAVVEAKRNINDLVHGFRQRQENLAWFVGDTRRYDATLYRTEHFSKGHFDRVATHEEHGRRFLFNMESFTRFDSKTDGVYRLDGLYFVTRDGPLLGTTMAELGRILNRVATDLSFRIESNTILGKLRKWTLNIVQEFQTRNALALYAKNESLARHIIFA